MNLDLVHTYPWFTPTMPSLTGDSIHINDEPIEAPPLSMISSMPISSSLTPKAEALKKRKESDDLTPQSEAIDQDEFEFEKVVLRDAVVLDTLVTYFDEGVFGKLQLKRDIYYHFVSDVEWVMARMRV